MIGSPEQWLPNNFMDTVQEYKMSSLEMDRRKRAFQTLSASLFLTVLIVSLDFIVNNCALAAAGFLFLGVFLLIAVFLFNRLFEKSKTCTVSLTEQYLIRKNSGNAPLAEHPLAAITKVRIKRNVKNLIREISLQYSPVKTVCLNGLDSFETFKKDLLNKAPPGARIVTVKELIDFDHPWFYVFFGAFVGILSSIMFRMLITLDNTGFSFFQRIVAGYVVCSGVFWIAYKPLTANYGKKAVCIDYLLGAAMAAVGTGLFLV